MNVRSCHKNRFSFKNHHLKESSRTVTGETKVAEERHIPTLGMTRSHRGNITLPCWECDAPTMGMLAKWRTFELTVVY